MRILLMLAFAFASHAAMAETTLIDPNTASESELAAAVGDEMVAELIMDGRPYLNAADLDVILERMLDDDQRQEIYAGMFRQINLNTASEAEIMLIPGMSKRMAHEFEEYRPYRDMAQFRREIGKYVDADEVARLEQYVFIPLNLNTASEEDIMKIPGMSMRMAHEFEEYRPYKDMAQFRREIGKYVDEDEVARLESYVTLD
ncbi:MAG: helix-hairpin-helix domain-containing protein [Woeseiaceae bacterium]|nr:helix-hairpin-helix domain-containing protein [Woeseiaceae bacterium]